MEPLIPPQLILANFTCLDLKINYYLFHQISMSVLQISVRVMKTLIAPTVKVHTAVVVSKDSLEMEQSVKVH